MSAKEEVQHTKARLRTVTAEYNAGLRALAESPRDLGLWSAAVGKLAEKKLYEARLRKAEARTD